VETYENIQMPAETRNYVPKLLAVRNIMLEPEKFGLKLDPFPNKPTFVATSNGRHMNIDIAAKLAEMPVAEFKELNPAFNLPVYAHKPGRQMLLPATKLHKFETNLAKWDKPLLTWQVFVPENDTTTGELASQFDMNPNELITANNLKGSALSAGRPVLVALRNNGTAPNLESTDIPAQPAESATLVAFAANAGPMDTPKAATEPAKPATQPDTLKTAEATPLRTLQKAEPARSDVTPNRSERTEPAPARIATRAEPTAVASRSEARFEPIRAELVKPEVVKVAAKTETTGSLGDNIPVSSPDKVVSASASLHTVAPGDTLYNISRRYSMSVTDLRSLNSLPDDTVKLGQVLKVIGTSSTALASATDSSALRPASYSRPAAAVAVDYVVQRGDTVFSIARKFGVSHTDILRWNNPEQLANLQPGQKVRVQNTGL
jgi:membrane-bound lytic murein transglycosylase D